jgi:hypothetical protein
MQPRLGLFLRNGAALLGRLDTVAGFLQNVEVILDILERALVGELGEQGFDVFLGSAHGVVSRQDVFILAAFADSKGPLFRNTPFPSPQ